MFHSAFKVGRDLWNLTYTALACDLKLHIVKLYHVDVSLLADVCIMCDSVCEWRLSAEVCSYKTVSFFLLSYIVLFSQWVNVCVCCRLTWLPEAVLGRPVRSANTHQGCREIEGRLGAVPNNGAEFGPEERQANTPQMALLFTCLRVPTPPRSLHFNGIRSAISRSPMATTGPCQRGGQLSHDVTMPWWLACWRKLMKICDITTPNEVIFSCKNTNSGFRYEAWLWTIIVKPLFFGGAAFVCKDHNPVHHAVNTTTHWDSLITITKARPVTTDHLS